MNLLKCFFFYLNALSVDIAIVAAIGFISINKTFDISSRPELLILLVFGTLMVYWFDHFRDIQIYGKNISRRHYLLFKLRIPLFFFIGLFILIGLLLVVNYFNQRDYVLSFFLFVFILIYLLFHQFLNKWIILKKEILISLLYTFSICFQVMMDFPTNTIFLAGLIFFTVIYGVITVSIIESKFDLLHQIPNIYSGLKMKNALLVLMYVFPAITILIAVFTDLFLIYFVSLILIQLLHLLMFKLINQFRFIQSNYRIISEWSFGLQILVLLF